MNSMSRLMLNALLVAGVAIAGCSNEHATPVASAETAAPANQDQLAVRAWGPQTTTVGVAANALPSGDSGLFVAFTGNIVGDGTQVLLDGKPLDGAAVGGDTVTALIHADAIATAGSHSVVVVLPSGRQVQVGTFVVSEPDTATPASDSADAAATAQPQVQ